MSTSRSRRGLLALVVTAAVVTGSGGSSWSQPPGRMALTPSGRVTSGGREFRRYCGSCHGANGKGDGPVAAALVKKPPDLTVLAKNSGGKFPEEHVTGIIDGSEVVAAHGSREMPIWGVQFRFPLTSEGGGAPFRTKAEVDRRIKFLVDYIKSIQEK